jgi:hypothetical protein
LDTRAEAYNRVIGARCARYVTPTTHTADSNFTRKHNAKNENTVSMTLGNIVRGTRIDKESHAGEHQKQ